MPESQRIALVTGASTGIGRAIAVELSRLGWPVAIGARRRDRLEETADEVRAAGGTPFVHELDVCDAASIDTTFAACEAELGVVDVVVNNAGLSYPGWLHELSPDEITREVTTNLIGPMLVSRRAVAALRAAQRGGDIVFITSDAVRYARPRQGIYAGTKAGLEQFARSLSMEVEGTGIRATTVRVGPCITEFGAAWDMDTIMELTAYWQRYGLQRHFGLLDASDVARAVATVVTARPGIMYDTLEVQPECPVGDDHSLDAAKISELLPPEH
jgi:NAD(P)-dependent dehydrogenase (short-subunit alcohol dehydrogenase family)